MAGQSSGVDSSGRCRCARFSSHSLSGRHIGSGSERGARQLAWRQIAVAFAGAAMLATAIPAFAQAPTLQAGWAQLSPTTAPPERFATSLAYDAAHGQVVMFGGFGYSSVLNDTWVWNGTNWANVTPSSGNPSARSNQTMAYDDAQGEVVLFGGSTSGTGSSRLGDTWLWNGTSWSQVTGLATTPPARSSAAMAYDAADGQIVLFGGLGVSNSDLGDTWVWNGTSWAQATGLSASPSARWGASMSYDAALGEVILFGGFDQTGVEDNDTWAWNGSAWTQLSPASSPTGRDSAGMDYDAALGQIVLFGGELALNGTYLNDTWVLSGNSPGNLTWTQQTSGTSPAARATSAMAYDAAQNQVVLFGGYSNINTYGDTWNWGLPQNFGSVSVCAPGTGVVSTCSNTLTLTYNVPATTTFGTPQVVMQGAAGLDFSLGSGGSCAGAVNAGTSCTVLVTFAPQAPGLRTGAVNLFDGSGTLLTSTPIYGNGLAPEIAFAPAPSVSGVSGSPVSTGTAVLSGPLGIAADEQGNLYLANSGESNVLKVTPNGAVSTVGSGFVTPQGVAIDGAGDLFVADPGLNTPLGEVVEIPAGCTVPSCQVPVYAPVVHPSPAGVAVDGLGNLFIADPVAGVLELPAGCTSSACQVSVGSGWSQPEGVAVDAAGDLFVADAGLQKIVKVPAGCATAACQSTVGSGWSSPQSVAVDAAGDVFVADPELNGGSGGVEEVPAGCTSSSCQVLLFNGLSYGVATNASGEVFISEQSPATQILEINQSEPPSLSFETTDVGSMSNPQYFSILNAGDQPLVNSAIGLTTAFQLTNGISPACDMSFTLLPGQECSLTIDFVPVAGGNISDAATLQNNSLNGNPATQTFNVAGTAVEPNDTLYVNGPGGGSGTVVSTPVGIDCSIVGLTTSGTCVATFAGGTIVTLEETPAAGSAFTTWAGSCANSSNPTCNVTVSPFLTVSAVFSPVYTLTVTDTGNGSGTVTDSEDLITCLDTNGTVSGTCSAAETNSTVTLTAEATGNSIFAGWGGACASSGVSPTCTVTMSAAMGASASFVAPGAAQPGNLEPITAGVVWGQGGSFTSNANNGISASSMQALGGVLVDPAGNLYAADGQNNRVLFFPRGSMTATRVYGQNGSFTTGTANNGGVSANSLSNPQGLALDSSGDLYVADEYNNRVLFYPAGSTTATRVYGQNGSFTTKTENNGGVSANSLGQPYGLAVDASGGLYVSDYQNNRVLFYPAGSTTATRVYGQGGSFTSNAVNNGGISASSLNQPTGVALDSSGDLYIADIYNNRVLFYPSGSTTATRVYGQLGSFTSGTANNGGITADSLDNPMYPALDSAGDLYVVDRSNNRMVFYPFGSTTATRVYGQLGSFTSGAANNGGISANSFSEPWAVAVDNSGNVYVSDYSNNRVLEYGPFGNVNVCPSGQSTPAPCSTTVTLSYYAAATTNFGATQVVTQGATGLDFTEGTGGTCTGAFSAPGSCTVNVNFAPLAPGLRMGAVHLLDSSGNVLAALPIYGVGQAPAIAFGLGVQSTVGSGLVNPYSIAEDAAGNIFIADWGDGRVVKIPAGGGAQTTIASGLSYLEGVAVDGAGNVYTAEIDDNLVLKIPAGGGAPITVGSGLNRPAGVAVDGAGNVFIADYFNNRVVEVPANGGAQTTVGSGLNVPQGVAVDGLGDVIIADSGNNRVVKVSASGVQTTLPFTGLDDPIGVAADAAGDVFVTNYWISSVFELTPSGVQTTVAATGLGTNILGVAVNGSGDIFIADFDNNRVVEENLSQAALNFGAINVGSRSADIGITIQDVGNQALTGSLGPTTTADFAEDLVNSTCTSVNGVSLVPGATCVEGFYAQPTTAGPLSSTAAVSDNSFNGNPATQVISLSATGISPNFTLTVATVGSGSGTVTDNSSAIACTGSNGTLTGTCSGSYPSGTNVTLTATVTGTSAFLGWGGACASSGTNSTCIVTVNAAASVTASFVQQDFGSANACPAGQTTPAPCSAAFPITFNIPANTTIGAVLVVTQGASGLDFTQASGSTCTPAFSAPGSCNVNVNFAPLAPGLRLGAVELYNATGGLIASAPIYGIGVGPVAAFSPAAQVQIHTGSYSLVYPAGLLVDASGNLFIADGDTDNQVLKLAPDGSISTVGSGFALPQGMAEDGAGNLFVANNNLNEVIKIPAGCTQSSCQAPVSTNLTAQLGVAVDGAGDLFVGDFNGEVAEIPSGCTSTVCQKIVYSPGAPSNPVGLTADAAGDVFIADNGRKAVVEVPAGCTAASCQKLIGSGWQAPDDVAVDAAGDVYVADEGLGAVVEVPAGCAASACQTSVVSGILPAAVALDGAGDVFVGNVSATQPEVLEITRSLPPSLSFAVTNVGASNGPQTASVQNVGNGTQPLSVSVGATSTGNFSENAASSACGTSTPANVLPGGFCYASFTFTPTTTGILTDSADFSDNTMNLASSVSVQTVNLSGIGSLYGATGAAVPNVVGMTVPNATTTLTTVGLTVGTVSTQYSSSEPQGSVIGESPAAGSPVNLGSPVALLVSTGEAPPPAPDPLTFENNYFVTGDYAAAGVSLKGATAANNLATGTITVPDLTTCGCSQGVPDGADIIDAFLYWTTIENTATPSGNNGTFLGYSITGEQVGSDIPNYSDGTNSGTLRVYRADINTYFQPPPSWNGERLASGPFTVSLTDINIPSGQLTVPEGASMVVLYRALVAPGNPGSLPLKSIVIYDGSALPSASTTQTIQGFYDAVGGNGELTTLYNAGGTWSTSSSSVSLAAGASSANAPLNAGAAYAAVIFSTPVANSDNDGILDSWKAGPAAPDFFAGQPGYYDVRTQSWVALPGAKHGEKDLFVQLDWMCGSVDSQGNCTGEDLFPSPDPSGADPLSMVEKAFANTGIVLHLKIGNPVPETTCTDNTSTTPPQLCEFPGQPGVIGWKNSLEFTKLWPRNFNSCAAGGDCTARFPYGQKDSYHYVLFGHSLAVPAWSTLFGTLKTITANASTGQTTITTADRGSQGDINYCPSRFTISGVLSDPGLNGVYNTASCPDGSTIILSTPGVANWSYANNTPAEPVTSLTSGTVTSISGYSDLGGQDSAVTLGLWETDPTQDMSKRAQVIAGTLFHEIGHTLGLTHGGLYFKGGAGSYIPTFDINCKPNYQSSMNYLFQLDGVGLNAAVAYSNQTLETLSESTLNSVGDLLANDNTTPATFSSSAWYQASAPANSTGSPSSTESAAQLHCDGTPLNGDTGYFVEGSVAPVTPPWQADQDITFDGVQPGSTGLTGLPGYDDVANIDLRQVGATGGEYASLANFLSFGASSTPVSVSSGQSVAVGAGGTVSVGDGGSVELNNGGSASVGSGAVLSGGGTMTFSTGGSLTLSNDAAGPNTITPGADGKIVLPGGGTVTLSGTGTITMTGTGGTVTLGGGGNVTLGGGGTITLPDSGGTVTIPSTGGSYTVPAGGTVTLGGGGNVTLGGGGTVTLGGGGNVTLGGGGNVTLGAGGNVTLGAGGTVTLGGGGNVTLGGGGNVTLGAGGTVTLGGGGTVTLGGGGNVTLGGGGSVTLGGGGNLSIGAGGTITLGAGGNVTLGAGGTITLGAGGTVTLGGGGNVTLGGGGTITLGGGGTETVPPTGGSYTVPAGGVVTLSNGGTVTLGGGGNVTLGGGGTVTLGGGGTVTLGGGGNVTLGGGGNVTLGGGGNVTLGAGGNVTLGGGGNVTLGGGGSTTTEMDYDTANSIVRPPGSPTYSVVPATTNTPESIQVNWTAPVFGVVATYTISRSVNGAPAVVIGSVSGVNGNAPATTFTDTNPPAGTLVYTITTTLVADANGSQRQSAPSPPAVLTMNQTVVLGSLPSSVLITNSTVPVTATAESNGAPNMQLVSFSASGPCSVGDSTINTNGVSSATVALNSTGSCTITATQAGDSTTATTPPAYSAATPATGTFTILPQGSTTQSQTIALGPAPTVQYGNGFTISATSSSGLPLSFAAPLNGPCAVGSASSSGGGLWTTTGTASGAGLCLITVTAPAGQVGSSSYSQATVTQSFYIAAAPLTVTAASFGAVYGQSLPSLTPALNVTYSITGFVNGDTASVVSGAPGLTTTATPTSGVGAYPITVSTGTLAAANYSFLYVNGTLTIAPAGSSISLVSSTGGASNYGQLVTFTPTVTPVPPGTDSVLYSYTNSTINSGASVPLGSVPVTQAYSTFLLPPGTNTVTATFGGANSDPNFQSSSASVTQVVASVPVAFISPDGVAFPSTDVGSTSASMTVVLTNIGTAPLNVTGAQIVSGDSGPADFIIQSSTCSGSLLPWQTPLGPQRVDSGWAAAPAPLAANTSTIATGDSCTVTLAFAPNPKQGEGVRTGTLVFTDNDGGQTGATDSIALTGSALSGISGTFPMPPAQSVPAGDYLWFNSELSVEGPLDPNGNPLKMSTDEVQIMVTNGSISFTNPTNGTTTTIPVPDALIQFVPGLTQASTTFDATNNRWVTQVPMTDPASGRQQFTIPGNIFVSGVPYLLPAAIGQLPRGWGNGPGASQNVTWSAEFTTDTPGVLINWQWGAAVYNPCFGNQPTSANPTCAGESLNMANLGVLGVNSADPGKCPIAQENSYNAGTPYNFLADLVSNEQPGHGEIGPPDLYTGQASESAGVVPAVTPVIFTPSPLVFMPVNAGQSSGAMTITMTNQNESLPFNLSGVSLTGSNAGDFAITATTCTNASGAATFSGNSVGALTLAPAGGGANSCTLSIVFTPGDLGTRTSSLVFTYATPPGMAPNETPPPQTVELYGTGAGGSNPIVGLSAVSLTFPHQEQGTTSSSQTVTLVNAGGGPLTINSIAASGEFGASSTCPVSPATLARGGVCTISVWFQPLATSVGSRSGAITIIDNNNGVAGSTQTISLSGQASP